MSSWPDADFIAFTNDLKLNISAFIGQIGGNANRLGITILEDSGRVHDITLYVRCVYFTRFLRWCK